MKKTKQFLKGFGKGFKNFSFNISLIINSILLLIVYLLGVGLTSIFAKLSNKKFLDIKKKKKLTYWSDLNLKKEPFENYYKQF